MLTDDDFIALVEAAGCAPSADNMQAWEFARRKDAIEVFIDRQRVLPTDVNAMFGWIGVGAAIENLVMTAAQRGFLATVEHCTPEASAEMPIVVRLSRGGADQPLADCIHERVTNRGPYDTTPLPVGLCAELAATTRDLDAGIHWVTGRASLGRMADMDARSTYIRLEHKPLHDEVFDILRFSRQEVERTRYVS